MAQAREWFDEIVATGRPADEFAFAGLANCYRQMPAVSTLASCLAVSLRAGQLLCSAIQQGRRGMARSRFW